MRLVVATTTNDPWTGVFWKSYTDAGGPAPAAVLFLASTNRPALSRAAVEGTFLFGIAGSVRLLRQARTTRSLLMTSPWRVFPGTETFHYMSSMNTPAGREWLESQSPDLLVSVGVPEIIKSAVLRIASVGSVNLHNGRLPLYRGRFGTFWEMFDGASWGYTTIHVMVPRVDAGAVLAECAVPLGRRALIDVLASKKERGGRLLAWMTRHVECEGSLPAPRPPESTNRDGYHSWPSLRDILAFRLRRLRLFASAAQSPRAATPSSWPPEAAVD